MIDFTSSLYLGMKHGSDTLKGWEQLTTGAPAFLKEPAASRRVGEEVARMQELEAGVTSPSTLHLYSDLYEMLAQKNTVLFIDEKIYPVSRYGIEKLYARGIPVYPFRHFDDKHLAALATANGGAAVMPVIMTDGWCPLCGRVAPLREYLAIARKYGAHIIIDDTQAFGILGKRRDAAMPYGYGGGGSLQWLDIKSSRVATVTSLAKAFGVPMAALNGSRAFIDMYKKESGTRVHSSPVSIAHLQAGMNALHINRLQGDRLRERLWQNIKGLGKILRKAGIEPRGGIFPVQTLSFRSSKLTIRIYEQLKRNEIITVLLSLHDYRRPALCFVLRTDHSPHEIIQLADQIRVGCFGPSLCKQ